MSVLGSFIDQLISDDDPSLDLASQAEELEEMARFADRFAALFAHKLGRFADRPGLSTQATLRPRRS